MELERGVIENLRKIKPTLNEARRIRALRDYTAIRKKYFGDTIPEATCVSIIFVSKRVFERVYGPGRYDTLGCCTPYAADALLLIAINEESNDCIYLATMVHEMAHAKIDRKWKRYMGHGKLWQAEMKRLARLGAFEPLW
jgi:hypothetical protein